MVFKQYKEAIESSNIVSKTDINGIITFVNDEFCKISGYTREELIGKNHNIVRHPDVPKANFKKLWDTILAKKTFKATVKNRAKDGSTFYVNTTIIPILDEQGAIEEFIAIRYDVTKEVELKMALEKKERELEILNQTLEERVRLQTRKLYELNRYLEKRVQEEVRKNEEKQKMLFLQSRMASLGQMMANIAHQWRQPLTELTLSLFNLKKAAHRHDTKGVDEAYIDAKGLIGSMSQTIDDFIDFFKPGKSTSRFDVAESIEEALQMLKNSFEKKRIEMKIVIQENGRVIGVRNELSHVIVNLLQNAKEAIEQRNIDHPKIILRLFTTADQVCLEISDNAGGIEEDVMERIFEPYFTTKHASQGTGLGLFMAKMIIEKGFGGTMTVQNAQEGAAFLIQIPKEVQDGV